MKVQFILSKGMMTKDGDDKMKKLLMVLIIIMILFINLSVSFAYPQSIGSTNYFPSNMNDLGYKDLIIFAKYSRYYDTYRFFEVWIDTESTMVRVYNEGVATIYKRIEFNDDYRIDVKYMDISGYENPIYNWEQFYRGGSDGGKYTLGTSTEYDYQIVYSTMNLYNKQNELIYLADRELELYILLPINGYKDNSIYYNVSLYSKFPVYMNPADITYKVKVNGLAVEGQGLYHEVLRNIVYEVGDGLANEVQFVVELPVGENIISVEMLYEDEFIESKHVTVIRLSGFIDENGDGLDDRTGLPDNSKEPIQYPDYDDVETGVSGAIQGLVSFLGASLQAVGQVGAFMKSVFAFLPREIIWLMTGLITVSVVIGIWKLIRG